jgi:predicted RNA binding protein YcfA (HicA-like mRNA interferase family)
MPSKRKPPRKRRVDWPSATGRSIVKALQKCGYELTKVAGSHHFLEYPDRDEFDAIQVPVHGSEELPYFRVKDIWKQAHEISGLSAEEFLKALK